MSKSLTTSLYWMEFGIMHLVMLLCLDCAGKRERATVNVSTSAWGLWAQGKVPNPGCPFPSACHYLREAAAATSSFAMPDLSGNRVRSLPDMSRKLVP